MTVLLLLTALQADCANGGRDAHDIAADMEGTVSSSTADHLLRDVDLAKAPVTVAIDGRDAQTFGANDQQAFEDFVHSSVNDLAGATVHVTQQVLDDSNAAAQELTLTLEVQQGDATHYVPVVLDLVRDGRRMVVTRAQVMSGGAPASN